jgi:GTPase SAR1 family protein
LKNLFSRVNDLIHVGTELSAFLSDTEFILIRDSYKELFEIVFKDRKRKIVISGTPGIGKTLFLIYCTHELVVNQRKTVYLTMKGSRFNYIISHDGYRRLGLESVEMPEGLCWYYLVDSVEPYLVTCSLTMLSVSPRMKFANEFRKAANIYYMPLWKWEEIQTLVNSCRVKIDVSANVLRHRFEVLNGVPRKLFMTQHTPEEMIELALAESKIESLMTAPETTDNKENVSHLLIVRTTEDFIHFQAEYASRYVSERVFKAMKEIAKKQMYSFVRSSSHLSHLGPIRGTLYEYIAHDLLKAGGLFFRRKLDMAQRKTNKRKETIPQSTSILQNITLEYCRNNKIEPNTYVRPKDGFESVDAWIQNYAMFQMTIKKEHDIKKLVHEISVYCRSEIFYFVVPDEDSFQNFRYQTPSTPDNGIKPVNIKEFVLLVPVPEEPDVHATTNSTTTL